MNPLNSVLIEGVIVTEPKKQKVLFDQVESVYLFDIKSVKVKPNKAKEELLLSIELSMPRLIDHIEDYSRGVNVRIVGRIRQRDGGAIGVCAEHIELGWDRHNQ